MIIIGEYTSSSTDANLSDEDGSSTSEDSSPGSESGNSVISDAVPSVVSVDNLPSNADVYVAHATTHGNQISWHILSLVEMTDKQTV